MVPKGACSDLSRMRFYSFVSSLVSSDRRTSFFSIFRLQRNIVVLPVPVREGRFSDAILANEINFRNGGLMIDDKDKTDNRL